METKMRVIVCLFISCVSFNIFSKNSCPVFLKKYKDECTIYELFNNYKNNLTQQNINIENISYYRMIRFINEKDIKTDPIDGQYHPWNIYKEGEKHHVWRMWEKGDEIRKEIYNRMKSQSNEFHLDAKDIAELHKASVSEEIRGIKGKLPKIVVPLAGELRSGKIAMRPGFSLNKPLDLYEEIAIKELEGIEHSSNKTKVSYVKSEDTAKRFRIWNQKLNELVNDIKNNKLHPSLTPLQVIADLQREFVAIHPFHEGVGRTSRFIQDIICDYLGLPYIPAGKLQNDVLTKSKNYVDATKGVLYNILNIFEKCANQLTKNDPRCVELYKYQKMAGSQANYDEEEKNIRLTKCPYYLAPFKEECAIYAQYSEIRYLSEKNDKTIFSSVEPTQTYAFSKERDGITDEWYKGDQTRKKIINSIKAGDINAISTSDIFKMMGIKNFRDVHSIISAQELDSINDIINAVNNQLMSYTNGHKKSIKSPFSYLSDIESLVNKSVFTKQKKYLINKYLKDTFLELLNLPPELLPGKDKSRFDRYKDTFDKIKKCYTGFDHDGQCDSIINISKTNDTKNACLNNDKILPIISNSLDIIGKIEKKCYIQLDIPISDKREEEIEIFIENKKTVLKQVQLYTQPEAINSIYSVESNALCNHEYNLNNPIYITYYDKKSTDTKKLGCFIFMERTPPCKTFIEGEKENEDDLKHRLAGESVNIKLKIGARSICYDNSKSFSYKWNSMTKSCEEYILKPDNTKHITKTFPSNVSCEDAVILLEWTKEPAPILKYDDKCGIVKDVEGTRALIKQGLNSFFTKAAFEAKIIGTHFKNTLSYRLDQVLSRVERTQEIKQIPEVLYRGIKRVNQYKKGDTVIDSGFASATPSFMTATEFAKNNLRNKYDASSYKNENENDAGTVLIFNNHHKKLKGVYIDPFSRFPGEDEYLFHPKELKGTVVKTIFIPKASDPTIDKQAIIDSVNACQKDSPSPLTVDDYDQLQNKTLVFLCPNKSNCISCP